MSTIAHRSLLILAGLAIASAAPANAASYNYSFPDGSHGFALTSQDGVVNPGVIAGFNPQPDPPAFVATTLSLSNPAAPVLVSPGPCDVAAACTSSLTYGLVMSFTGIGNPVLADPPAPDSHGDTSLAFTSGDLAHNFVLLLNVTGPGAIASWVAFNPQPDPPASWFAVQATFTGDPQVSFQLFEDGRPLSFQLATPLPATLPLFGSVLAGGALLSWRRRQRR
jgi:hypothetical protein